MDAMFSAQSGMTPRERLVRTVWLFGSVKKGPYGAMTFAPNGDVTTRHEPNEHKWALSADASRLMLLNTVGEVTCELAPGPVGGWLPVGGFFQHFLHPMLALGPPPQGARKLPPVFINTVPKAGTYLMARAFEQVGYGNTHLHVMDNYLHDNRGVPENEIHWEPDLRKVVVPAEGVAALLRAGEFAVGHVEALKTILAIEAAGVRVINIAREPRAQLLSMFVFLRQKVKPTPDAALWQSMEGLDAFKAFLGSSHIRRWIGQTRVMVEHGPLLRFEDLRAGEVSADVVGRAMARKLSKGLAASLGQQTSTLLARDPGETAGFTDDPAVVRFLDDLGAMELSRRYWPEMH